MATKKEKVDDFTNEWMQRIRAGIDYRKKFSDRSMWDDYRNMYRSRWEAGLVPVNKMFSFGRMMVPRTYFRSPMVTVTATRPDMIWHAKVVEAIDNLLMHTTKLKKTLKRSITDAFLCGLGPIKLGYDSEFGYMPEQAVTEDGETLTQESRTEEATAIEYNVGVKPGMPWALRVRPEDVIVPWGSEDSDNLPWIAHYILRPLDDVKQDQKYRNTSELKGARTPDIKGVRRSPFRPHDEQDKDIVYAELFEVRDVKTRRLMVFCEDQLILSVPDVLQRGGLPWELIAFNPDPEYFWPIPDATILYPQQKELNATRTQAARHRAIALIKFLYLRGKIKPEELAKMLSGEVGPAVAVDDTENVATAVQLLEPHIPPDLYKEAVAIINDMREGLGFSSNQLGEFSPYHGKSATESMIVEQSSEARSDERRDIVADVAVSIVEKWNQMIFEHWTESRVIQIVSPEGQPYWVNYTGDQLKGNYLLTVDIESGMPVTRGLKYQMSKDLLNSFNGDQLINQMMLRQIVLGNYSTLDPRVPGLLVNVPGLPTQSIASARQPTPLGQGAGKGAGGGREGSSPEKPMEFEQLKSKFAGRA